MTYDELLSKYDSEVKVKEKPLAYGFKGLYSNNRVYIDSKLDTDAKRYSILAEELGHHYTTYGNILDQTDIRNVKQENIARQWAYERIVGIIDLINASNANVTDKFELAEYLNVPESFLDDAISYYRKKYGTHYQINNYLICFEPTFGIMKLF